MSHYPTRDLTRFSRVGVLTSPLHSSLGNEKFVDKFVEEEVVYERRKPKVPPSRH